MAKTISELLNPAVREWVYAILMALNAGLIAAAAFWTIPAVVFVLWAVVNASGFTLAKINTNNGV